MKLRTLSLSVLALSAALAAPALAQGRVDANGMPTTSSTPAEQAATAALNDSVSTSNAQADTQNAAQQQQYQQQLLQNQNAQSDYQDKAAQYAAQAERYENLRARYAAERAAYHRGAWGRYERWTLDEVQGGLIGQRVQILNGDRVGTVEDIAQTRSGRVTALLVRLDSEKIVWIDQADIRYSRGDSIVMTNLSRGDLRLMADQRL